MDNGKRPTVPPPPPVEDWQQELRSGLAELQDEVAELATLLLKCYARTSNVAACLVRLGNVISRTPNH